jgi:hypothetical protein
MKKLALIVGLILPSTAFAQQVAAQTTCGMALDGGAVTQTNICGPVLLNYQPFTVDCQVTTGLDAVQGTVKIQTSGDGVHFGAPTNLVLIAQPDGGQPGGGIQSNLGGGSAFPATGAVTAGPGVATTADVFDAVVDPTDPWLYAKMSSTVIADGGAAGDAINCYFSVVQTQTLHAPHGLKGVKPQGVKVTQ